MPGDRRAYDRERNRVPARRAAQAAWKRSPRGKLSTARSQVRIALRRMPGPTRMVALLARLDAIEREIARIDGGRRSPNPRTTEDFARCSS